MTTAGDPARNPFHGGASRETRLLISLPAENQERIPFHDSSPLPFMKPPLLFLDIDGVLNSRQTNFDPHEAPLDPVNIAPFNRIIDVTGAEIVITSDWRCALSVESIASYFKEAGIEGKIVDATPDLVGHDAEEHVFLAGRLPTRGEEIGSWFRNRGVSDPSSFDRPFAILDDRTDVEPFGAWLINTSGETGLTEAEADRVIGFLAGPRQNIP